MEQIKEIKGIKDCNVIIDGRNFFDQPITNFKMI